MDIGTHIVVLTINRTRTGKDYLIYYDPEIVHEQIIEAFNEWSRNTNDDSDESLVSFVRFRIKNSRCFTQKQLEQQLDESGMQLLPLPPTRN